MNLFRQLHRDRVWNHLIPLAWLAVSMWTRCLTRTQRGTPGHSPPLSRVGSCQHSTCWECAHTHTLVQTHTRTPPCMSRRHNWTAHADLGTGTRVWILLYGWSPRCFICVQGTYRIEKVTCMWSGTTSWLIFSSLNSHLFNFGWECKIQAGDVRKEEQSPVFISSDPVVFPVPPDEAVIGNGQKKQYNN